MREESGEEVRRCPRCSTLRMSKKRDRERTIQYWHRRIKKNHGSADYQTFEAGIRWTQTYTNTTYQNYHIKELLYGQVSVGAGSPSLSTHATSNSPLHEDETGPSALQTKVVPLLKGTKKWRKTATTEDHIWFLATLACKAMSACWLVHHFGSDWNSSTTIGWTDMKFCTDIHSPQRMNPYGFGDPLIFPLAPPWG